MVGCIYLRVIDYAPEIVPGQDMLYQCLNQEAQKAYGLTPYFSEKYKEFYEGSLEGHGRMSVCDKCTFGESHEGKVIIDSGRTRVVVPQEVIQSSTPENTFAFLEALRNHPSSYESLLLTQEQLPFPTIEEAIEDEDKAS